MNLNKIPTTVVTGFLGSGKTTLLRNIIENAEGRRIAVIVNEFGELGIDGDLLKTCAIGCEEETVAADGVYELANGCLCCTVQEEFFPVMQALAERKNEIDHVLIETSGLALPKPLVQAFNWPEIKSTFTVDAVITVVDTPAVASGQFAANPTAVDAQRKADENLNHESPLHELFEDQLSAADLVVLSKTDLIDARQKQAVIELVKKEVPASVKIVETDNGKLAAAVMLGLQSESEATIDQRPDHHGDHHGEDHNHDEFDSISVRTGATDMNTLLPLLEKIVNEQTVYRVKGFVDVPGKKMRMVVHGVGKRFDHYFDRAWREDEKRDSLIVFIGHDLDAARIRSVLNNTIRDNTSQAAA